MARLDLARVRDLIAAAAASGAAEVEIEEQGVRIIVRKQAAPVVLPTPYMMPMQGGPMPVAVQPQPGYAPHIVPAQPAPAPAPAPAAAPPAPEKPAEAAAEPKGKVQHAPIVGTFFRRPAPDAKPFVEVGSAVAKGDTLCIIEAMKNMNEIESDFAGTVSEILVQDAEPVGYDQPLFVIA